MYSARGEPRQIDCRFDRGGARTQILQSWRLNGIEETATRLAGAVDPITGADPVVRALGYVAGFITTVSFLPQVIRSWRTRSAADLSLVWLTSFIAGISLWLVYGILLHEPPIIAANGVTLGLSLMLLWIRLRGRREK
jgi:MtN3 and saliva related transmembrane protein